MRIRTALERAIKDSPNLSEDGLNNLLKWHLLKTGTSDQQQLLSRKEAILLLLTLLLYDIPPPGVLKLKPSSKFVLNFRIWQLGIPLFFIHTHTHAHTRTHLHAHTHTHSL